MLTERSPKEESEDWKKRPKNYNLKPMSWEDLRKPNLNLTKINLEAVLQILKVLIKSGKKRKEVGKDLVSHQT